MTDRYQTQCPHCGVKFPITRQQLDMAKGNVRCGSCLQLFQASQHLLPLADVPPTGVGSARPATPPPRPATPTARPSASAAAPAKPAVVAKPTVPAKPIGATPPPPPRPAAPPAEREADDDLADMILQELDSSPEPASPPPEPPARRTAQPPAAPASAPSASRPAPPSAAPGSQAPLVDEDFNWTPSGRPAETTSMPKIGLSLDDDMLAFEEESFEATSPAGLHSRNGDQKASADDSWTKALLGETDEHDERVRKFVEMKADKLSIADNTGVRPKSDLEKRLAQLNDEQPDLFGSSADNKDDEFAFFNEGKLTSREFEVGQAEAQADRSPALAGQHVSWGQGVVWATLSVILVVALFLQYAAYNFDRLSRDENWRGFYESACGAIGCTVPSEHDVTRIQSANFVVRTHPTAAQALVVDAVIYNRAPFGQPFPRLSLSFSDINGNILAGRVFEPAEYLKGDLAADDAMPRDTPVHVTLEIVDPGSQAVGYALQFLPPAST